MSPPSGPEARAHPRRYADLAGWLGVALLAAGVLLFASTLPVAAALDRLEAWIERLGVWGPLAFALIYVVATVLMVPGTPLTLAAGAFFGLAAGTAVVSLASTAGAAVSFLISRYLARDRLAKRLGRFPKFEAIDRAIAGGGWKVVALLRLSPVAPFNLQNYLYGLTRIGFWTCVVTSWIAMIPGSFLYVYIGFLTRTAVEAAADDDGGSRQAIQWGLRIAGFAATVIVTVYVAKLARRELRKQAGIEPPPEPAAVLPTDPVGRPRPWGVRAVFILGVLALAGGIYARLHPEEVRRAILGWFGPPPAGLEEVYSKKPGGPAVDHSVFDRILQMHVDDAGWVDYAGLEKDAPILEEYLDALAGASYDTLGRDEKLALLINAYNAFTLRLILDHHPDIDSILDIPRSDRWAARRWRLAGREWSLYEIEHEEIRGRFREPRVHFALVCAAVGCPPLRREAYTGARLEEQLEEQARLVHRSERWFRYDPADEVVHLTELYDWYRADFEKVAEGVLEYAARFAPELREDLESGRRPEVRWIRYDWRLNDRKDAPAR